MERILGPNMKRLLAMRVSIEAVPPGGGMAAALEALVAPGRLAEITERALTWCDIAVNAVRRSTDNPYGEDEELIAAAILAQLEK